jgi:integrase
LAPASVQRIHAVVRGMFTTAVRWGWLTNNPAQLAKRPKPIRTRREIATPEQVARLLEVASPDMRFVIHLAATTGMRRGELVALHWSNVDLDNAQLHVRVALTTDEFDNSILIEKRPKSNQERRISLDANTVNLFRAQKALHAERAELARAPIPIDGYVVSDDCGHTPWRPDRITLAIVRLANKAGLDGFRFHDLRHFHASQIANAGIPLEAVRERLGHSSLTVTGLYLHSPETADRLAAETIGRILGG